MKLPWLNAIGLPVITTMLIGHDDRSQNGLNAFMVGLLRIKVLAFLKVVNMDMTMFILALSQILYDMHFFLFVLSLCVFLLGDMFHIAISKKVNGNFCQEYHDLVLESSMVEDFCCI